MGAAPDFEILLFDLGGVLIDFAGFEELTRLLPDGIDRAEVRRRWISSPSVQRFERAEIGPREFANGVVRELGLVLTPDEFVEAFVDWARGPYPGARSLLEGLKETFRLACLSNSNELHTPSHRRSIEPLFDAYYFSDELGMVKPEREIFEFVVADLGVAPERIVFFDDTAENVKAALEVGMNAHEVDGIAALEARLSELGILGPERDS